MVFPDGVSGPEPQPDMPPRTRALYDEARGIVSRSPRASSALLRLALEHLLTDLELPGKTLSEKTTNLRQAGLPTEILEMLDALRLAGNNAVHPGEIDLHENEHTALLMFEILNGIVYHKLTLKKRVRGLLERLPKKSISSVGQTSSAGNRVE